MPDPRRLPPAQQLDDALMPVLSDRQRVELAIPAYLLCALTAAPSVFVPADPDLVARAEADIAALRADLQAALLKPFGDLTGKKQHALLRRVERIGKGVIAGWADRSALSVMLTLWYFVKDLTDREVLILWEGSAMERATSRLLPMFAHGFDEQKRDPARARIRGAYGMSLALLGSRPPALAMLARHDRESASSTAVFTACSWQ